MTEAAVAAVAADNGVLTKDVLLAADKAAYIGEAVSQLQHALQCAYFAQKAGADLDLTRAAFLHDIGHLIAPPGAPQMAGLGIVDHELLGAAYLRQRGYSEKTCRVVAGHVQAKRYLVRQADYPLSAASAGTLAFQGGPMSDAEAAAFERDPLFDQLILVRKLDEAAKRTDLVLKLDDYLSLLI